MCNKTKVLVVLVVYLVCLNVSKREPSEKYNDSTDAYADTQVSAVPKATTAFGMYNIELNEIHNRNPTDQFRQHEQQQPIWVRLHHFPHYL